MIVTSTIQAYKDNTKKERERERKEDSMTQFTCLCHSLPVKIHKFAFYFTLGVPCAATCA